MSYIPAALRRTGYHHQPSSCTAVGFSSLPVEQQRALRVGAEHMTALGARALAELLVELAQVESGVPAMLNRLSAWRERMTPEMVRAVGGDRFPSTAFREVPRQGAEP